MRIYAMVACALALSAGDAQAARMTLDGSDFVSACSRPDPDWISFCHGYVQAAFDSAPNGEICAPAGTTRATLVGVVMKQLDADADLQSVNASSVVRLSLQRAYPCR
jgi:hypothetical protein